MGMQEMREKAHHHLSDEDLAKIKLSYDKLCDACQSRAFGMIMASIDEKQGYRSSAEMVMAVYMAYDLIERTLPGFQNEDLN